MLPLQIKQQKNMAFSQLFAPKVKEIQQKYRNNRDKQAEEMQKLQAQGVEILTCGTCLNFYGLTEKLVVGGVTNMYVIAEKMLGAGNVVKP